MNIPLAIAIYVICWWTVLFAILPFYVRTQEEAGAVEPGTPESAPARLNLLPKLIATTVVASILFVGIYAMITHKAVTLDDVPWLPRYDTQSIKK